MASVCKLLNINYNMFEELHLTLKEASSLYIIKVTRWSKEKIYQEKRADQEFWKKCHR